MPDYNLDAIDACMRAAQENQPRFGEIADGFPEVCTSPAVYGTLPSSAALAQAVDALNSAMHEEFAAAESRLDQVARALDAVVVSVRNADDDAATSMTVSAP
ncbi:hypothetical protein [Actinophytocola sp.]|uniref:hypothetical protein n=1 Tax=Actinophytocola sp. TaxID=1872138 RepID=UPI002D80D593|nr:hypothetical protein [Actinophytocola sp.]HET9142172.1 hypothetical protein [Actinophytocola sp.]